jgi:hypothetical protein
MQRDTEEHISKSKIKERGWSEAMIANILKSPDTEAQNPFYRSGPTVKLFSLDRIVKAEATPEFRDALQKKELRANRAKKVANNKKDLAIKCANDVKIKIYVTGTIEQIFSRAVIHYNDLWLSRGREDKMCYLQIKDYASLDDADIDFLIRISTNMYRHHFDFYDESVAKRFGSVGVHAYHDTLRERIDTFIATKLSEKMKQIQK